MWRRRVKHREFKAVVAITRSKQLFAEALRDLEEYILTGLRSKRF